MVPVHTYGPAWVWSPRPTLASAASAAATQPHSRGGHDRGAKLHVGHSPKSRQEVESRQLTQGSLLLMASLQQQHSTAWPHYSRKPPLLPLFFQSSSETASLF